MPEYVSEKLLRHLISLWSRPRVREHRRFGIEDQVEVEVGIGLRIASCCFAQEISEQRAAELGPENDEASRIQLPAPATHRTHATDTSPLGLRLLWPDGLPPSAQIGEIIALREQSSEKWRCIPTHTRALPVIARAKPALCEGRPDYSAFLSESACPTPFLRSGSCVLHPGRPDLSDHSSDMPNVIRAEYQLLTLVEEFSATGIGHG